MAVNVDDNLRRLHDRAAGVGGMPASQQTEVGDGLHVVEVRAGEHEEVAQHLIAVPVDSQIRQGVEDVVRAVAGTLDGAVNLRDEALEATLGVHRVGLNLGAGVDQRRMVCETEVDEPAPLRSRGRDVGVHEEGVILDRLDLPHQVVTGDQPTQHAVQAREPGCVSSVDLHHDRPAATRAARRLTAASTKPLKSGWGAVGRDWNSRCAWDATNQGWSLSSSISTKSPSGDSPEKRMPACSQAER